MSLLRLSRAVQSGDLCTFYFCSSQFGISLHRWLRLSMASGTAGGFESLGLAPWLLQQCKALAYVAPTDVQSACVPMALKGNNAIVVSQSE